MNTQLEINYAALGKLMLVLFAAAFLLVLPELAHAADPSLFGGGSETEAKNKLAQMIGRVIEFVLWTATALGLLAAVCGVAMSNGLIGDPTKGSEMIKRGIIVAAIGGAGVAIKGLIGWIIG